MDINHGVYVGLDVTNKAEVFIEPFNGCQNRNCITLAQVGAGMNFICQATLLAQFSREETDSTAQTINQRLPEEPRIGSGGSQ